MAKQVLAASLWYHASFQPPSEQLLKQFSQQLRMLMASAQQASHSDDAVALAQNFSQLSAYVAAFRALHSHRLQPVTAMLPSDVFNEPLFFNKQICQPDASSATANAAYPVAAFLAPQQKPLMLSAAITKVDHLRLSLQLQQPQLLASELSSVLLALQLLQHGAPLSAQPQHALGFRSSRPPADKSFKMLRQASSHHYPPSATSTNPTRACL